MISPSSSFPDLKAHRAVNPRRMPRKPPPVIDISERYPLPDPLDPFVPLWVLRNRKSSAFHGGASNTFLPPYSGWYGSQETLNNLAERSRSNSCFSSPTSNDPGHSKTEVSRPSTPGDNSCLISPSGSRTRPKPKPNTKIGHYTPHSQIETANVVGTLQAFPHVPISKAPHANVDLASPKLQRSWSPNVRTDLTDSTSSGPGSDDDDDPALEMKSSNITHLHLQQRPEPPPKQKAKGNITSKSPNPIEKAKSQSRFARFLLPKRTNFLISGVGGRASPSSTTSVTTTVRRSSTAEFRRVSKSSISAPQAVESTVIWDSSINNSHRHRGRVPTPIMNRNVSVSSNTTTNADLVDDGQTNSNSDCFWMPMGKSISLDAQQGKLDLEKRTNYNKYPREHAQECSSESNPQSRPDTNFKRSCTPVLRSLSVPLHPSNFAGDRQQQQQVPSSNQFLRARSRMTSALPISPGQPSTHPISNTSIVDISISAASFASNPSGEEDETYTSPRPAPQPPTKSKSPLLKPKGPKTAPKGDARHNVRESECRSSTCESSLNSPTPCLSTIPIPNPTLFSETEWTLPTPRQITDAASLSITCEDGKRVSFGSLFATTRTIVVFIRHFWCPLCQDYMSSLKSLVRPDMLYAWPAGDDDSEEAENLKRRLVSFVVISNGAHGMIHKYKQIFGLPFKVYTDPALAIYKALGMGRDGDLHRQHRLRHHQQEKQHEQEKHHQQHHYRWRQKQAQKQMLGSVSPPSPGLGLLSDKNKDREDAVTVSAGGRSGGYVKHGLMGGIAMVVVRAIKVGMPVWEKGGDIGQLGGEFIFGPGLTCSFAHRMLTTKGHAPIEDVLVAAGIDVNAPFPPGLDEEEQSRHSTPDPSSIADEFLSFAPASPLKHPPSRKRLSSLKTLKEPFRSHSRATSVSSGFHPTTISNTGGGDSGCRSKRHTRHFSTFVGMMSKEEEEKWMEHRQECIERLREKKNIRRGMVGRTMSAPGYRANVQVSEVFKPMGGGKGPVDEEGLKQQERRPRMEGSYWEPMEESEVVGKFEEEQEEEQDQATTAPLAAAALEEVRRTSFYSRTDSASSYSTLTDIMPTFMNSGSYICMETDDEIS